MNSRKNMIKKINAYLFEIGIFLNFLYFIIYAI